MPDWRNYWTRLLLSSKIYIFTTLLFSRISNMLWCLFTTYIFRELLSIQLQCLPSTSIFTWLWQNKRTRTEPFLWFDDYDQKNGWAFYGQKYFVMEHWFTIIMLWTNSWGVQQFAKVITNIYWNPVNNFFCILRVFKSALSRVLISSLVWCLFKFFFIYDEIWQNLLETIL